MSLPQPQPYLTPAEYLELERQAEFKSEYFAGEIFAMAGASRKHTLIVVNLATTLNLQLKKRPCEVHANDMRVKVNPTGLYTYPDVVVVCGKPQFEEETQETLLNPTVIIEVLSPSTENYDRGKKFEHYRSLNSLQEYLLVAQDQCHLEHYIRQTKQPWLLTEITQAQDTLELATIQCQLMVTDIYDKTGILI